MRQLSQWPGAIWVCPTGHFEAALFSESLAQYRDVPAPGAAVLLQLGAELQGEDVRARGLHAEPLDAAAAKTQKGLRIVVRDTKPLDSIARRLNMPEAVPPAGGSRTASAKPAPAGSGRRPTATFRWSSCATSKPRWEMKRPGRFKVSRQITADARTLSWLISVPRDGSMPFDGAFPKLSAR
jgi:DNA polymerase-3 subunit alpha